MAEDDLLDEVQVVTSKVNGNRFQFSFEKGFSINAGVDWFASTAFGKAIFAALMLAVFVVVVSHLSDL